MAAYQTLMAEAERDFEGFWGRLAKENLLWQKPFQQVLDESNVPFYKWFADGRLNVSYNCLDRHLQTQPDKVALIFEADDGKGTKVTYRELHRRGSEVGHGLELPPGEKGGPGVVYFAMGVEGG